VLKESHIERCLRGVNTAGTLLERIIRQTAPVHQLEALEAGPYNRPISVYRFPHRALTLCPQLCIGIQPGACFPARSADALPATLYGHFTQAIYRKSAYYST